MSPEQILKAMNELPVCSAQQHGEHWFEGISCALCLSNIITTAIDEALGDLAKRFSGGLLTPINRKVLLDEIDRRRNAIKERG